ncbi:MAG: hypothetical protein ACHQM6_06890 [Candidatus Kapaibacterium sp.]
MDHKILMPRFLFLTVLFLSGCSLFYSTPKVEKKKAIYEYSSTPLDEEYFHSPTGDIAGHIPKGWLQVNTESIPELENILSVYTDPDRSRAMVLMEIPGTADLRRKVERDGIIALAEESFQSKRSKHSNLSMTRQPEIFTVLDSLLFVNYEYSQNLDAGGILHSRVVTFSAGVRFYEISMVELQPSKEENQYLENFRILQSVIAGLEGVAAVRVGSTTR